MSADNERRQQVFFFNVSQHRELYENATRDKMMSITYLHDCTSPDSKKGDKAIIDLCEYVGMLHAWGELLKKIGGYPIVVNTQGEEEYIVTEKEASLIRFYSSVLSELDVMMKERGYNFTLN